MADNGFNGTTATFAGAAIGDGIRSIKYSEGGGNADVTHSTSAQKTYEGGIPDKDLQIDFIGSTTVQKNAKGALVVNWNDGTTTTLANAIVTAVNYGGQVDGEISGSMTVKPSTAA